MEELTLIIEQRRKSIGEINGKQEQRLKFQLIEEERKRNQRENWILRVLKSLKMLTAEQKRIIFETTHKIMIYYQPVPLPTAPIETVNFLELMINLFVDFFNRFQSIDFTHLKSIIRPNNNYIVVDLLKVLVDMGRKQFKSAMQQRFKEQLIVKSEKKLSVRSLVKLPTINAKSNEEQPSRQEHHQQKIPLQKKLRFALHQKYSRIIQICNFQHLQEHANQLYHDLLEINQRNSLKIQKYQQSCYGHKRHINYDASGLYTQEEIRKLVQDQRERVTQRISQMKQLKGECSSEQLKEYFKMQVELHEGSISLRNFAKQARLQEWFPLCLTKNGNKLHPFHLMVEIGGNYFAIEEFEERYGKKVKAYMRELLSDIRGGNYDPTMSTNPQYLKFVKKDFINYQNSKVLQLIHGQHIIVPSSKKEMMLPNIPEQGSLQKRKVKSQAKISNKSMVMPAIKPNLLLEKELQKRLNYSSILKEGMGPKRKIDSLILHYVHAREFIK